jgi:hypothetical protein
MQGILRTPELAAFGRDERRILILRARSRLRQRSRLLNHLPELLALIGAISCWLFAAFLFPFSPRGEQVSISFVAIAFGGPAGGISFGILGYIILLRILRPHIRAELEAVAGRTAE